MFDSLSRCCAPLGRLLLSGIFVMSGITKFTDWEQTAGFMESEGMVAVPFFLAAAAIIEIVGGLMLLVGWKARCAALLLALYLIPATAIFHDFWTDSDPAERMNQMQHFMKNAAIMGGLLVVAALGPGPASIDTRRTAVPPN